MTTGSALDASDVRLVRKTELVRGVPVVKYGRVTKASGPRCWVLWLGARGSSYEWCNKLEVL